MTPKPEQASDIQKTNRVIKSLRAALCKEEDLPSFVKERVYQQIQEIKDPGLLYSASSFYYFTIYDVDKGIEMAEKAVSFFPHDIVTWRQYIICSFWRCGALKALAVSKRAIPLTHSPQIAFEATMYASHVADYEAFLELSDFVDKTGKIDEFIDGGLENADMKKSMSDAILAKKYNKTKELHQVVSIMYEQLNLDQKLKSTNRLLDVSEGDEKEILFELSASGSSPSECANMNLELINLRIKNGCTDWSVGGVFVDNVGAMELNASFTE